jgi:hypothetical protein
MNALKSLAFKRLFESEVQGMIRAAYEESLIDSYAMHFMHEAVSKGKLGNLKPYAYFQDAKKREPRK